MGGQGIADLLGAGLTEGPYSSDYQMATKKTPNKRPRRKPAGGTIYPNSPLAEVTLEIRFPGEPAIECRRDEFFARVRKAFPQVLVPTAESGRATAAHPYKFKSGDDSETVVMALNLFAFSTKNYKGFRVFGPQALALIKEFCRLYGIKEVQRLGLRYTNIIPFVRQSGQIPWGEYFTVTMTLAGSPLNGLASASLAYTTQHKAGSLTTRIASVSSKGGEEAFLLDFDFAKTNNISVSQLQKAVREIHRETKRVFNEIVTEQYKAVMRGEAIA